MSTCTIALFMYLVTVVDDEKSLTMRFSPEKRPGISKLGRLASTLSSSLQSIELLEKKSKLQKIISNAQRALTQTLSFVPCLALPSLLDFDDHTKFPRLSTCLQQLLTPLHCAWDIRIGSNDRVTVQQEKAFARNAARTTAQLSGQRSIFFSKYEVINVLHGIVWESA